MRDAPTFEDIAYYYDSIMKHVPYDRWYMTVSTLAELMPHGFIHLDAACGTGTLLKRLDKLNWTSFGIDICSAMLRAGRREPIPFNSAAADLRALPFRESIDYVTCLFDSLNFLLDIGSVRAALSEFYDALRLGGILYFDIVTERMVTEYFAGQKWKEDNGRFSSAWESDYNKKTALSETRVSLSTGSGAVIREQMYPTGEIETAVLDAGFKILAIFDAETWDKPRKKTTRIDFIAVKGEIKPIKRKFKRIVEKIRLEL